MITRSPSLTDQVKAHLRERILAGAFEDGRIPSETELAADLGVSRTTVRDALSRLENEGAIYRKQGAGTFVNEPGLQIKSRLEEIWSYRDVLEAHGYTPSIRLIGAGRETASPGLASDLGLEQGDEVLVIEKVFLEDDLPVILTYNRIPASLVSEDIGDEEAALPLPELLEGQSGRQLAYYLSEIVPVALPAHVAGELGVPRRTVSISFEEIGYDQDNVPVTQSTSYFRDDLLRFRLIRRNSGA